MSELKNMIMALPPSERLDLATLILQSLSAEEVSDQMAIPQAWIDEALAEAERMEKGAVKTFTWEEVKANVKARTYGT
jgi:putative addiction module component (TIGR02574 family)